MSDKLITSSSGGFVTLAMNRPELHNAFDDELIENLSETLAALAKEPSLRAVVLTGTGESFSAGGDVNWMKSMASASREENQADALRLAQLMRRLNYLPVPTIALVNGAAFGGGVGLIACCDIVLAADNAVFGVTEVRLGLAPAVISPYVFRKIGERAARRYFLTGEKFDAAQALKLGLVSQVVPHNELDKALTKQLELIRQAGPQASRYCKQLAFAMAGHDAARQEKLDQRTAAMIAELRVSSEGREGLQAFLDKRAPDWAKGV